MFETLRTLNNSALEFLNASYPEDVYNITVSTAQKLAQADYGSIFFHRDSTFYRIYSNVPKNKQGTPSANGLSYYSLKTGKTHIHTRKSLTQTHPEMCKNGVKGIILIPLKYQNKNIGVLALQSNKVKTLRKQKMNALQFFGSMASLSIQKVQEYTDLRESIANRDLFISLASHELKNPVATISMYSQLIRTSVVKESLPQTKWVDVLYTETSQLTHLINELLTREKFSLYDMDYKWTKNSLRKLIQETLEKYQITHPDRKFIFLDRTIKKEKTTILADCNKMQQVIINILNNAVKFSPQNQPITIALHAGENCFCFSIKDKGNGIPKENRKKLFEKFFKGNSHMEGMGLGLYVAKTIIDKHQGKIAVKSFINKGTTIQVSLPKIL